MKKVKILILIDSNFFIALINENDQWNKRAVEILKQIKDEDKIVADVVILESITMIGKLFGGEIAKALYDNIKDNYSIHTTTHLYNKAMKSYLKYDGVLSLTDMLIIEYMKDIEVNELVSFDSEFDNVEGIKRIY